MRFNELKRELQGVTQRVLTHQLRELEADGLVSRRVYAEVPPRVEYSLTHLGVTLVPVLDQLETWAKDHCNEILESRRQSIGESVSAQNSLEPQVTLDCKP